LTLEAITFCFHVPQAFWWLFLLSIGGYLSVVFVLLLIKVYAATYAECVKGLRKVFSIGVSYLFIGDNKVFSELHALGISFFILSSGVTIYEKYVHERKPHKDIKHNNLQNKTIVKECVALLFTFCFLIEKITTKNK